jgi:hypothetical protein
MLTGCLLKQCSGVAQTQGRHQQLKRQTSKQSFEHTNQAAVVAQGNKSRKGQQRKIRLKFGKRIPPVGAFISELPPSKVHILPVCIRHFMALIALGYSVPLVVQYGLHLLRHCNVHRLDFPAEQLVSAAVASSAKEIIPNPLTVCARATPSIATQENAAASPVSQLVRDRRSHQCERT